MPDYYDDEEDMGWGDEPKEEEKEETPGGGANTGAGSGGQENGNGGDDNGDVAKAGGQAPSGQGNNNGDSSPPGGSTGSQGQGGKGTGNGGDNDGGDDDDGGDNGGGNSGGGDDGGKGTGNGGDNDGGDNGGERTGFVVNTGRGRIRGSYDTETGELFEVTSDVEDLAYAGGVLQRYMAGRGVNGNGVNGGEDDEVRAGGGQVEDNSDNRDQLADVINTALTSDGLFLSNVGDITVSRDENGFVQVGRGDNIAHYLPSGQLLEVTGNDPTVAVSLERLGYSNQRLAGQSFIQAVEEAYAQGDPEQLIQTLLDLKEQWQTDPRNQMVLLKSKVGEFLPPDEWLNQDIARLEQGLMVAQAEVQRNELVVSDFKADVDAAYAQGGYEQIIQTLRDAAKQWGTDPRGQMPLLQSETGPPLTPTEWLNQDIARLEQGLMVAQAEVQRNELVASDFKADVDAAYAQGGYEQIIQTLRDAAKQWGTDPRGQMPLLQSENGPPLTPIEWLRQDISRLEVERLDEIAEFEMNAPGHYQDFVALTGSKPTFDPELDDKAIAWANRVNQAAYDDEIADYQLNYEADWNQRQRNELALETYDAEVADRTRRLVEYAESLPAGYGGEDLKVAILANNSDAINASLESIGIHQMSDAWESSRLPPEQLESIIEEHGVAGATELVSGIVTRRAEQLENYSTRLLTEAWESRGFPPEQLKALIAQHGVSGAIPVANNILATPTASSGDVWRDIKDRQNPNALEWIDPEGESDYIDQGRIITLEDRAYDGMMAQGIAPADAIELLRVYRERGELEHLAQLGDRTAWAAQGTEAGYTDKLGLLKGMTVDAAPLYGGVAVPLLGTGAIVSGLVGATAGAGLAASWGTDDEGWFEYTGTDLDRAIQAAGEGWVAGALGYKGGQIAQKLALQQAPKLGVTANQILVGTRPGKYGTEALGGAGSDTLYALRPDEQGRIRITPHEALYEIGVGTMSSPVFDAGSALGSPIARGTGRVTLPANMGGGFWGMTSPYRSVLNLRGPRTSQELLDASIAARNQLATTGRADVVVGGRTYTFRGDRFDEAMRLANPQAPALVHTAAPDVAKFSAGGPVPILKFPDGRIKPASDQFQFFGAGAAYPRFTKSSAFGNVGDTPGIATYGFSLDELSVPGSPDTPWGVNYFDGRELELGRLTGEYMPPVDPVAGTGPTFGTKLYLPEDIILPSYQLRLRANLLAALDKARLRHTSRAFMGNARIATPDEVARARFGRDYNQLTPGQARHVDISRMNDADLEILSKRAGPDAVRARGTLDARSDVRNLLKSNAAQRRPALPLREEPFHQTLRASQEGATRTERQPRDPERVSSERSEPDRVKDFTRSAKDSIDVGRPDLERTDVDGMGHGGSTHGMEHGGSTLGRLDVEQASTIRVRGARPGPERMDTAMADVIRPAIDRTDITRADVLGGALRIDPGAPPRVDPPEGGRIAPPEPPVRTPVVPRLPTRVIPLESPTTLRLPDDPPGKSRRLRRSRRGQKEEEGNKAGPELIEYPKKVRFETVEQVEVDLSTGGTTRRPIGNRPSQTLTVIERGKTPHSNRILRGRLSDVATDEQGHPSVRLKEIYVGRRDLLKEAIADAVSKARGRVPAPSVGASRLNSFPGVSTRSGRSAERPSSSRRRPSRRNHSPGSQGVPR